MGRTIYGTDSPERIDEADGVTDEGDVIFGYRGDDTIHGYGGDDWLKGGGGADRLYGHGGSDTADYGDSGEGVVIDLRTGNGRHGTAEGDVLVNIENLTGSQYDDVFDGDDALNVFNGRGGDDALYGNLGDDTLYGGSGNDRLRGGPGADHLDGGPDRDLVDYSDSSEGVSVNLRTGVGYFGTAEGDTLVNVEYLSGSEYDDLLVGDDQANSLIGGGGADSLKGGGGSEYLFGGNGTDNLWGDSQGDYFGWWTTSETGATQATADIIWDFNYVQGDRITLSPIDADVYAPGNQFFRFIGTAAFTLNAATPETSDVMPGEIRYYHAGGNTYIELQTGTSPDIEGVIRLNGIHTPTADWFVL